jgi:hypothetical protein
MDAPDKVQALLTAHRNLQLLGAHYEALRTCDEKLAEAEQALPGLPEGLATAEAALSAAQQSLDIAHAKYERCREEKRRAPWFNWRADRRYIAAEQALRIARTICREADREHRDAASNANWLNQQIARLHAERFSLLASSRPGPAGADIETAYVEAQQIFLEALDSLTEAEIDAGVLHGLVRPWEAATARGIIRDARRTP